MDALSKVKILISFAYINKGMLDLVTSEKENSEILIDSGAFTKFNAQKTKHITLDNYCSFLEKTNFDNYIMLDVIGNEKNSKNNYETMLKRGLNPMYVFTMFDKDFSYLKDAVKNNNYICVAGGVTTKGTWLQQRFIKVHKETKARIHGLGYVSNPDMYQLPIHSVDSSSWNAGQKYGLLKLFVKNKLLNFNIRDFRKRNIPYDVQLYLERYRVLPKDFKKENMIGQKSIQNYFNIIAYLNYMRFSELNKIKLYLAISNRIQLHQLYSVVRMIKNNTISYEKFRNIS